MIIVKPLKIPANEFKLSKICDLQQNGTLSQVVFKGFAHS